MRDAIVLLAAYLLGSVPTGYVLTRVLTDTDLRRVGSGGTGATNAVRALGWRWGVVVLVVDLLKGVAAVALGRALEAGTLVVALAGSTAVLAHCWPVWLRFRGGKGVATGAGAAIALTFWSLLLVPVLLVPIVLTRYVSLGSVVAALATPLLFGFLVAVDRLPAAYLAFALLGPAAIVWRHRSNIERLRNGTERRLGRSGRVTEAA